MSLRDNKKTLPPKVRNLVDYILVSENIETGSWDENPKKTALCYKALKQTDSVRNKHETTLWMKKWVKELKDFNKTETKYRKNLRTYIEGAIEISLVINLDKEDRNTIIEFLDATITTEGSDSGSWLGDPVLTSKAVKVYTKWGRDIDNSTKGWLGSLNYEELSVQQKSALLTYSENHIDTKKLEELLRSNVETKKDFNRLDMVYLLETNLDFDTDYGLKLIDKLSSLSSIHINAGITKALWQSLMLKESSFSKSEIENKLKELDDRYWADYISSVNDSTITLDMSEQLTELSNSKRDLVEISRSICALSRTNQLEYELVSKKDMKEVRVYRDMKKREDKIIYPFVADRVLTTFLGILSGLLIFFIAWNNGLTENTIGTIIFSLVLAALIGMGYGGSIRTGVDAIIGRFRDEFSL